MAKLTMEQFVRRYHKHKEKGVKFYCPLDYYDTMKLSRGVARKLPSHECESLMNVHRIRQMCELSVFESMLAAGEITPTTSEAEMVQILQCGNCPGKKYMESLPGRNECGMLNDLSVGMSVVALDGRVISVNQSLAVALGYPRPDFSGVPAETFYRFPKDRVEIIEKLGDSPSLLAPRIELVGKHGICRANIILTNSWLEGQRVLVGFILNYQY